MEAYLSALFGVAIAGAIVEPREYIIKGGVSGRERLKILSGAMAPHTNALLDAVNIPSGARVLDVGCGGGDVTLELAKRAGLAGHVTGFDIDDVKISLAKESAPANVDFRVGDFTKAALHEKFDVVYARFLLSHLHEPLEALLHMLGVLKPGGMLVAEDVDFSGHFCHPPRPAFDRYVAWYQEAAHRRGVDALLGRRLPQLFALAGLKDINVRSNNPAALSGPIKRIAALTLSAIADNVVAENIADRAAVDADIHELEVAAGDPTVFMSIPRIVQVWARN